MDKAMHQFKTFRFRLKSPNLPFLEKAKNDVNFVWNYCNDTAIQYFDKKYKWLSEYDLGPLTKECSRDLFINAQSIQAICKEFVTRRNQSGKRKLSWRSKKRSLGWIPVKSQSVKVIGDSIIYSSKEFKFWKSRQIEGAIKSGSFNQDARGNWFVSLYCECAVLHKSTSDKSVGIDLGLKAIATLSDGIQLNRDNIINKYSKKLSMAQRSNKKKLVVNIHTKIKNTRRDWNHKHTAIIANSYKRIVVGDVSPSKLKTTHMAKSVTDAGWADFKSMLAYKAIALGVEYKEVKENFSTVTCSVCFERTGPSGLSALGVREWTCACGTVHDRDVNAARNILRFGCESPIKGSAGNPVRYQKSRKSLVKSLIKKYKES